MAGCGLSEDACFSSFFYNYTSSWETSYNQAQFLQSEERWSRPLIIFVASTGPSPVTPCLSCMEKPRTGDNTPDVASVEPSKKTLNFVHVYSSNSYGSGIDPCGISPNLSFEELSLFFYLIPVRFPYYPNHF
ncbi:hypothetical protein TURU_162280 [Turdus rufiventris]|nr:hypothetical protein TURU_162280 [Turdus rufiventris]